MKELRVLALVPTPYDVSPGQRFRIEQWEPHLRRDGIRIDYAPFLTAADTSLLQRGGRVVTKAAVLLAALRSRLGFVRRLSGYDVVYLFRESAHIGPAIVERILAARGIPYVFDYDDAVWLRYVSPANAYYSLLRLPGKTATTIRLAAQVMAGNSFLARYATRYNHRVTVVPTTIDTEVYRPIVPRTGSPLTIGWTGSYSTARYLEVIRPALERLRRRRPFRMLVVGAEGFTVAGVDVECRPWRSVSEVQDLSEFDMGVMPLLDDQWERGKCGLKALQYMALGIPAVVSPVGVNAEIVANGIHGLYAHTTEQWEESLDRLLEDVGLRTRLGSAGRARVEEAYAARVQAPRVAAALRDAVS